MPDAEPGHDTSMALKDVSDSSDNLDTGKLDRDELETVHNEGGWEGNASDIRRERTKKSVTTKWSRTTTEEQK